MEGRCVVCGAWVRSGQDKRRLSGARGEEGDRLGALLTTAHSDRGSRSSCDPSTRAATLALIVVLFYLPAASPSSTNTRASNAAAYRHTHSILTSQPCSRSLSLSLIVNHSSRCRPALTPLSRR